MAGDPTNPEPGELNIDATALASFIVDLPAGALLGKRNVQDGFADASAEIMANQAAWGDKAGITQGDFEVFKTANDRVAALDKFILATDKLAEMLNETKAQTVDQRERTISAIAQGVETRAKAMGAAGDDLLAKYEKTRAYRSAVGFKAAKTRVKNAEARAASAEPESPAPGDEG